MLIQDFVQISTPYALVAEAIRVNPHDLLDDPAICAYREGEALCIRLTPTVRSRRLGKRVAIDIAPSFVRGAGLVVPIHWWATGASRLFPRLDGDLEVMPLGEGGTQLTLMGRYEAPLATLGRGLDRMFLHRVAEASVRAFLHHVASHFGATNSLVV